MTAAKLLKAVLEKFREKFGASDVKKYHLKFDVALLVRLKSFPPLIWTKVSRIKSRIKKR